MHSLWRHLKWAGCAERLGACGSGLPGLVTPAAEDSGQRGVPIWIMLWGPCLAAPGCRCQQQIAPVPCGSAFVACPAPCGCAPACVRDGSMVWRVFARVQELQMQVMFARTYAGNALGEFGWPCAQRSVVEPVTGFSTAWGARQCWGAASPMHGSTGHGIVLLWSWVRAVRLAWVPAHTWFLSEQEPGMALPFGSVLVSLLRACTEHCTATLCLL